MDPITITTSIFGLLKATETIAGYLGPYVSAARDTSQIVRQVHSEVVYTRTTLLALEGLIKNISSVPVRRAALIQVDQLVAVFTDGVLLFSELEASLPSPPSAESSTSRLPILSRLKWARKESTFTSLFTRLQGFKGSISLMLTILQSDSDSRAAENQKQLSENVAALLESNRSLYLRLLNLEDALEVRTIRAIDDGNASSMKQQPDESIAGPTFDFENDLETSRVYRKAQRESMDFSFRSSIARTNAWSVFSGLSLSDVSNISVIALPLYREDIENAQHYGCTSPPAEPITTPTTARGPKSLCEECLELELRLSRIPGIPEYFEKVTDDHLEEDPLTRLILVLRQGLPLLMILEKFQGFEHCTEVGSDYNDPLKLPKAATYKFISTCVHQDGLRLAPDKCFSVSELFGHDSTGFMKVSSIPCTESSSTFQILSYRLLGSLIGYLTYSIFKMTLNVSTSQPTFLSKNMR
ncbi:uncharacterized protein LY89DRAFT_395334 [Mollisia scopiformis]|uniref:Cdc24/Scd1 N-terminal domain-containing protein n=1 Tax=Mollisia scopiformis TaxID=149040 RepID=A0A194XPJ4_MOLSC|nr:uncharacterized protein LY89DRAFT_395334 [Mollisia scopiformis]KUJ22170.1 hypothetical protein LY89DRAFT_395334 [Mollisia scopiformis]